jgi:hypothetical protein
MLAVIGAALAGCGADKLDDGTALLWPDSGDYKKKVEAFKITPEEAHKIAAEAAAKQEYTALGDKPLLIVGEDYLYGAPGSRGVWLTGFYVNGLSGAVEFRKVDRMVYTGLAGDLFHP